METTFSRENKTVCSYIVFFDLDQTLTKSVSGRALVREAFRKRLLSNWDLLYAVVLSLAYRLKLKDPLMLIDKMVSWTEGIPEETMIDLCTEVAKKNLIPYVYPDAIKEITRHKAKNAKVVILSSALTPVCQSIAQALGFDDILCSGLEVKNGYLTGRPSGHICFGMEKAVRLTEYCKLHNISPSVTWYYGDSVSDLPPLSTVGNPVCINPDSLLKREAAKKNWKVLRWKI